MNASTAATPPLPNIVEILGASTLFGTLETCVLTEIGAMAEIVQIASGAILFNQGEVGDDLYIVIHGRLRVEVETSKGTSQLLGEVGYGESVGEMAVLINEPRSATVSAIRNTELIKLSRNSFEALIARYPQAIRLFAQLITERLSRTINCNSLTKSLSTLTIVPLGMDVPKGTLCEALMAAFSKLGSTRCITSDLVEERWSAEQDTSKGILPSDRTLTHWMNVQENQCRFLLYVADPHWSVWTQHCIQQSDRILLVAWSTANHRPTPLEAAITRCGQDRNFTQWELVLLHRDRYSQPIHTKKWLIVRNIARHHHVCISDPSDFERLARILTGKALGLVLGGGGARAFAHIGVLRALQEAGIAIDWIGGTSMGAILAAQYAAGWNHTMMKEANKKYFLRSKSLMDYTVPFVSLIKGKQFIRILNSMFGETCIEDLWLPYFCVSSNLTQAKVMVHQRGLLQKWLCASISIPGIGPPLCSHRNLLVDGGVLNNLPVDIMKEKCLGSVIAVDVGAEVELIPNSDLYATPSPWKLLWQFINPFADRLNYPAITDILWRSATLSSKQSVRSAEELSTLFIQPPLQTFKIFDWHCLDAVSDISYRFAKEKIASWQEAQGSMPLKQEDKTGTDEFCGEVKWLGDAENS